MKEQSTLVKFGQKTHIEALYNYGELYMNDLPFFWGVEGDEVRHDLHDSIAENHIGNRGDATLKTIDGKDVRINITTWNYRAHPANPESINLFCMYALRPFHGSFPVDEKNFKFGSNALVLLDAESLVKKIATALKKQKITFKADLVEYVPDNYVGEIGPFRKRESFQYQSEWRLVCFNGAGGPRKIRIGSLKKISRIIPSEKINSEIKIIIKARSYN